MSGFEIQKILQKLLNYSFDPIDWKWNQLTETEKDIIKDQSVMDELKEFANQNI